MNLVVDRSEVIRHLLGGEEVRRALDADGEGVHGLVAAKGVLRLLLVAHRDGGDEGRVEASGQEHGIGNVRHQTVLHSLDDRLSKLGVVRLARGDVIHVGDPLGSYQRTKEPSSPGFLR